MEQNRPKFRLRLNLFDGIVLAVALAVAAFLGWMALNPPPSSMDYTQDGAVRYTLRLARWPEGTSSLVQEGDQLTDMTKSRALGEVVGIQVFPARMTAVDQQARRQVLAEVEGYEDVVLTIDSPCLIGRSHLTLDGKEYILRVGTVVYLRGQGYMGSGTVESVEITQPEGYGQEVSK